MTFSSPVDRLPREAHRFPWEKAIREAKLGTAVTAVALILATYANADGTSVRPGDRRVAEGIGVSLSTVERAMRDLREGGWLTKVRDRNHRAGLANEYRLTLPLDHPAAMPANSTASRGDHPSPRGDRPSGKEDRPSPRTTPPVTGEVPPEQLPPHLHHPMITKPSLTATATKPVVGGWARAAQELAEEGDSVAPPVRSTPTPIRLVRPSELEATNP